MHVFCMLGKSYEQMITFSLCFPLHSNVERWFTCSHCEVVRVVLRRYDSSTEHGNAFAVNDPQEFPTLSILYLQFNSLPLTNSIISNYCWWAMARLPELMRASCTFKVRNPGRGVRPLAVVLDEIIQ